MKLKNRNNLSLDNLSLNLSEKEGGFNFGIDLEIRGVRLSASTEDGGTIGVGFGFVGIEVNAEGGGKIEFLDGVATMEADVSGCIRTKSTYILGELIHTEVENIPGCAEPEEWEPGDSFFDFKDFSEDKWDEAQKSFDKNLTDWNQYDFSGISRAIVFINWEQYQFFVDQRKDGNAVAGYFVHKQTVFPGTMNEDAVASTFVIGLNYTNTLEELRKWSAKSQISASASTEFYSSFGDTANNQYTLLEGEHNFAERGLSIRPLKSMKYLSYPELIEKNLLKWERINEPRRGLIYVRTPMCWYPERFPLILNVKGVELKEFLLASEFKIKGEGPHLHGYIHTRRIRRIAGIEIYTEQGKVPLNKGNYYPPIPNKEKMSKCCYGPDDRKRDQIIYKILNPKKFPGLIKVADSGTIAEFPTTAKQASGEGEFLINDYADYVKWQALYSESALLKDIEKFLGVSKKFPKFPMIVPNYLEATKNEEGKWEEDINYPKIMISNLLELEQYKLKLAELLRTSEDDAMEKIETYLGIGSYSEKIGEEKSFYDPKKIGFPLQIPDYRFPVLDDKGKPDPDTSKYPKIIIKNLRELTLYKLDLERRKAGADVEKIEEYLAIGASFEQIGEEKSINDPEEIGFPLKFPDYRFPVLDGKGKPDPDTSKYPKIVIKNLRELAYYKLDLERSKTGTDIEKIKEFFGIGAPFKQMGKEVSAEKGKDNIGFPLKLPNYLKRPKNADGKWEKDLDKYPKITINNYQELSLYFVEMFQELYRFSGALPTVREGYTFPLDMMIRGAPEGAVETVYDIPGMVSRLGNIIDARGLPFLKFTVPSGKEETTAEPMNNKVWLETVGNNIILLIQKITRIQITVSKFAVLGTDLHKLMVLIYRLVVLIRKQIGVPFQELTGEDAKKAGQDTVIKTQFNLVGIIKKALGFKDAKDNAENSSEVDFDEEDIDKKQELLNEDGYFGVKGFRLKGKTIPLWGLFFNKK